MLMYEKPSLEIVKLMPEEGLACTISGGIPSNDDKKDNHGRDGDKGHGHGHGQGK